MKTHPPAKRDKAVVVQLKQRVTVKPWKIAVALPGGNQILGSMNRLWLAPCRLADGGDVMAYIKALDERRLCIELICAAVGNAMGVPCPAPLLVIVRAGNYGIRSAEGASLMFGSQAFDHPDVARPLRDRELILHNLRQAKLLELAGVFDEWIANSDRHDGQILFGSNAGPIFIDHEQAIGKLVKSVDSVKNWIVDEYVALLSDDDRKQVLTILRAKAAIAHTIDLASGLSRGIDYLAHGADLLSEVTNFLSARLPELDRLLSIRTNPSQGYLHATSVT